MFSPANQREVTGSLFKMPPILALISKLYGGQTMVYIIVPLATMRVLKGDRYIQNAFPSPPGK